VLLSVALAILLIGAILYACGVLPLWIAYHCARARTLSAGERGLWMALILVLFPFGSWLYAMVRPAPRLMRASAWASVVCAVVATLQLMRLSSSAAETVRADIERTIIAVSQPAVRSDEANRAGIKAALVSLEAGVTTSLLHWDRNATAADLADLARADLADSTLTGAEYDHWKRRFDARNAQPGGFVGRTIASAQAFIDAVAARSGGSGGK